MKTRSVVAGITTAADLFWQSVSLRCHVCRRHKLFGCECGWILIGIAIAGVVVAAAGAGYGAYAGSEAQAQQARNAKRMARHQADADAAAGEARRKQVMYDAKRKAAGIRTREAAAGVQIGQGSLLEDEMQFAADNEYAAQIAQLPYSQAEDAARFEGRIFGSAERRARAGAATQTGIATGSTLATGASGIASNYYARPKPTSAQEAV